MDSGKLQQMRNNHAIFKETEIVSSFILWQESSILNSSFENLKEFFLYSIATVLFNCCCIQLIATYLGYYNRNFDRKYEVVRASTQNKNLDFIIPNLQQLQLEPLVVLMPNELQFVDSLVYSLDTHQFGANTQLRLHDT